jgi:hypothetical protein
MLELVLSDLRSNEGFDSHLFCKVLLMPVHVHLPHITTGMRHSLHVFSQTAHSRGPDLFMSFHRDRTGVRPIAPDVAPFYILGTTPMITDIHLQHKVNQGSFRIGDPRKGTFKQTAA